jgi:RNA polymerase sigma-70 factor (ECF subfamily)
METMSTPERIDAEALFREHASYVASFAHRLGVPRDDVHDLVQEVFLVAHRKGGYEQGAAQPRTWLCAIAVRLARKAHRERARRDPSDTPFIEAASALDQDPSARLETQRSLELVQRALDTLDLEHRAAFVLYEIERESCESIAAALEVPLGTVYSRLHHARRRFMTAHEALVAGRRGARRRAVAR